MKNLVTFLLFFSMAQSVFADMTCDTQTSFYHAKYRKNQYLCESGYFLPANTTECKSCLRGFTCSGGNFYFDATVDQGLTVNNYTCDSGYFLPANTLGCVVCPTGFTCNGGTFAFNSNEYQGLSFDIVPATTINNMCATNFMNTYFAQYRANSHECSSGYYLPANVDACTQCPANSYCVGGTYSFNETTDQGIQSCASGTFAPTGSAVCYPHILHVGDSNVYLKSTKQTTPSLNFRIGNDIFYANMTTTRTRMNKDSTHYFHAQWENNHYYVCDDTTCP